MGIRNFTINFPGQTSCVPRFGHLHTITDTLATVSAAGYLDNYIKSQGFSVKSSDIIFVVATDGTQIYKPVFTAGSCQLTVLP